MSELDKDNPSHCTETLLRLLAEPSVDIVALAGLSSLNLAKQGLTSLPDSLALCTQLVKLDVGGNPLQTLPEFLPSLSCLEILFAPNIGLTELPPVLASCSGLRMLGVSNNRLRSLDGLRLPADLVWLIAAGNEIVELPNIARCERIRKLMLSHNQLTCQGLAPAAGITDLEMVRVAANNLEAFPTELSNHPRLSWVAVGGNPFAETALARLLSDVPAPDVHFGDVVLGDRLGSGAGATVYRGEWRGQAVAVKIWDGERFSDGTARGEWAVNRVAGAPGHEALVGLLGAFDSPRPGMLLELLSDASAAASPPSFATVTRDATPSLGGKGPTYRPKAAASVALAVASACEYLHSRGLSHGDVYLHNTLVVINGPDKDCASELREVRLSDFGAAAAVDDPAFEKIEVRSFGWLLQDLLESLPEGAADDSEGLIVEALRQLRTLCGGEVTSELPDFATIVSLLQQSRFAAL